MAFEIDHDWQGNLATPRARIGAAAKNRLLIVLCAIWIVFGLVGHAPWKPNESSNITIVKSMLHGGSLLVPVAESESLIENPPLYYLSAAGVAKLTQSVLPMHDGARLVSGVWMAITLLMVGMIGRELWGEGVGRQTTFIFMSSIGLIVSAHLLMPEVAALTGSAMGFYALALAKRRPFRASALLGSAVGVAFLSTGILSALSIVITALLLPVFFKVWRSRSYRVVLSLAVLFALPWLVIWPLLCWHVNPQAFHDWWSVSWASLSHLGYGYFIRTLAWYAWPALPIAGWGIWHYRFYLLSKPKFQLILTFFFVSLIIIGLGAVNSEINALPLLIPIAAMAGGSVETLKRGAASALNWFGLTMFGMIGVLIWVGWFAVLFGKPAKFAERMHVLSGLKVAHWSWLTMLAAIVVTAVWVVTINAKRSNRAAVTDWAVGMTMAWSLLMSLWLPMLDSAKSYQSVMAHLQHALPKQYGCINTRNVGNAQLSLLYYYTDIHGVPLEVEQRLICDLYLIRDERGQPLLDPGSDWHLIWHGKRPADRKESFRLFQLK